MCFIDLKKILNLIFKIWALLAKFHPQIIFQIEAHGFKFR